MIKWYVRTKPEQSCIDGAGRLSDFENGGLSPSGKAQDFDSCISLVRIQLAQLKNLVNMGKRPYLQGFCVIPIILYFF